MSVGNIKQAIKNSTFISFTGYAQTGKDSATEILKELGFQRVSLADPVRQGIYNINPIIRNDNSGIEIRLQDIVKEYGWELAKKYPEVRRLLQFYGTEGGRQIFGDTIWTDTADKYIRDNNIEKVAVSDVRFPNELDWARSKSNNLVIKIKRQGVGPINNHISDAGIPDSQCDFIINNDGSLEDLKRELL